MIFRHKYYKFSWDKSYGNKMAWFSCHEWPAQQKVFPQIQNSSRTRSGSLCARLNHSAGFRICWLLNEAVLGTWIPGSDRVGCLLHDILNVSPRHFSAIRNTSPSGAFGMKRWQVLAIVKRTKGMRNLATRVCWDIGGEVNAYPAIFISIV